MHLYHPLGLFALLGIPVIIVFYILKQKHQEIKVPSVMYWDRAAASAAAQNPWQKLRKNLLMFLQIFAVALLALALSHPYFVKGHKSGSYLFVLDSSMSMQAKDVSPSRFQFAKSEIKEMVEKAPPNSLFSMIVMSETPYVAVEKTVSKGEALQALQGLSPTLSGVDVQSTTALIALLKETEEENIFIFTDKEYDFSDLSAQKIYVGASVENCGIPLVSHNTDKDGLNVLVKVKNYGLQDQARTVGLYDGTEIIDVAEISLSAGQEQDVSFTALQKQSGSFTVRLTPSDALEPDDTYYYAVHEKERKSVLLVTEENIFLEKVFSLLDVSLFKRGTQALEELSGHSLYVFDGVLPQALPTDGYSLIINPPAGNALFSVGEEVPASGSMSAKAHSLLEPLPSLQFSLSHFKEIPVPVWAESLLSIEENRGEKSILFAGQKEGNKIMVLAFDLHQSDLPLKMEFPIFTYQILNWFFPEAAGDMLPLFAGGQPQFTLKPATVRAEVKNPQGQTMQIAPPFPPSAYAGAQQSGFYSLLEENAQGESGETLLALNALSEGESQLQLGKEDTEQTQLRQGVYATRSLREIFILLLLVALAGEWWVSCRGN